MPGDAPVHSRRLLWGVVMLVVVCALTFVLFRVLPTANPAVLRAGRDPQPKLIKEIERRPRAQQTAVRPVLGIPEAASSSTSTSATAGTASAPVLELIIERLPATISLCVGRRDPVDRRRASAWGSSRRSSAENSLDRVGDDRRAGRDLGPGILARHRRAVPLRQPTSASSRSCRARAATCRSRSRSRKWFGSLVMPWIVRRRRLGGGLRAADARQPRRTMGEDYIRTARAKGLPERSVTRQGVRAVDEPGVHALRA